MAGHGSSLLHPNGSVALESTPLLYPEEQQTLKELAKPACQYRNPKCSSAILGRQSQYMSSLRATLRENLMGYEERVVDTEPPGAPPPHNSDPPRRPPSPLINSSRDAHEQVFSASANANRLAPCVKQVGWIHLLAYLVDGVLDPMDPLASVEGGYKSNTGVRHGLRIRVERSRWWVAFSPDRYLFDEAAERIKDMTVAGECFGNYFLQRNGEFALALLRETERLEASRLPAKPMARIPSGPTRGTDLLLAIFRTSLDTTAQNDLSLDNLRFTLVDRPLRAPPFPPTENQAQAISRSRQF
ncbi:hypothetical protein FRC09_011744 [Ceratobasidium sp. 395]|nr:hypothetical protein FRC09_011744 [Ceratobasidium sp. 395]